MKLKMIYNKQILIPIFLMICFQQKVISQGTDISASKSKSLYIGLSIGPSLSSINNIGDSAVSKLSSGKKGSFLGFIEIGYFFSDNFGLSSGIGFTTGSTSLTLKSYQNKYNATDSELESYERRVTGSDISETQKISFLCVPICFNMRLPVGEKAGFFLQTGLNLAVPITKSYNNSGKFSFKGYYSAYNVTLENLPLYGFPSNVNLTTSGKLDLKPLDLNFIVSAGFDIFVQEKLQIAAAVFFDKSLSNISNYSDINKFQLSQDVDKINSLMGGCSKATVQSIGLKIALRYYLR
jgi:hypothetical protein